MPNLSIPNASTSADLPGIRQSLTATRHLLERYRRQLADEKTRRKLQRLDRRLRAVASQLERLATAEKIRKDKPVNNHPSQKTRDRRKTGYTGLHWRNQLDLLRTERPGRGLPHRAQ